MAILTPKLQGMPPPEVPIINRENGTVERVWYDYLKSLDVLVRILLSKVT
jgi:hypothetical protein